MRRTFLVAVGVWAAVAAVSTRAAAGPTCEIDAPLVDLGTVLAGTQARHDFTIRNTGDEDLKLDRKSTSCGCTVLSAPRSIEPHGAATIGIRFEVGSARRGTISVHFGSNDPDMPQFTLTLQYRGVEHVFSEPAYVDLSGARVGKEGRASVAMRAAVEGRTFRILKVRPSAPWLGIDESLALPTEPGMEHTLVLTVRPPRQGTVRERVIVRTDDPKARIIEVPVLGTIAGPYRVEPGTLSFGTVAGGKAAARSVSIQREDRQLFSLRLLDAAGAAVEIAPEGNAERAGAAHGAANGADGAANGADGAANGADGAANAWRVTVTPDPTAKAGLFKHEIALVATDHTGACQEVAFQALGVVRDTAH
ncbi:MAG: DUF1573 domain-containing protein [Candidatus Hydrogenedentes bacterium]|nr:DUF1573 domain-containing protein [Candidatus Hydrogenedentota bacterium]